MSHSLLERAADKRDDAAFVDAAERQSGAGGYVIGGELIVLKKRAGGFEATVRARGGAATRRRRDASSSGSPDWPDASGIGIIADAAETLKADPAYHVSDLRSIAVQGLVAHDDLTAIAEAKALLHWHARHRLAPIAARRPR